MQIDILNIKDLTLRDAVDKINSLCGVPLKRLSVYDLVFSNNQQPVIQNGVYIIECDKAVCYVGTASSRCFVERIPSHFDLRSKAWFNNLIKNISATKHISLEQAALYLFNNGKIKTIGVNGRDGEYIKRCCRSLENVLRMELQPIINRKKMKISENEQCKKFSTVIKNIENKTCKYTRCEQ